MIPSCLRIVLAVLYTVELLKVKEVHRKSLLDQWSKELATNKKRDKQSQPGTLLPLRQIPLKRN